MQSISPEMYPQLIEIINHNRTEWIESIVSAGLDGNNDIVCLARVGGKQLAITIEDENNSIEVRELGVV